MTLKQWLENFTRPLTEFTPEDVRAYTDAYYRANAQLAEDAFTRAFLKMRPLLPVIDEKGEIQFSDGRTGTYATNEDIQEAIAPILQQYGFALHFETSHPSPAIIHVDGVLTHRRGHSRRSSFESPADMTGGKTVAQGRGSILSYGHRYCTVDLLNLITRGIDNDGATVGGFAFDPQSLDTAGRAVMASLLHAITDRGDSLDEQWAAMHPEDRAALTPQAFQFVKRFAHVG